MHDVLYATLIYCVFKESVYGSNNSQFKYKHIQGFN
jgi:hypothetical protein